MDQSSKQKLLAIPTNVITGFLGVGKTTAISHLLAHKPEAERWAVLVNEFGEVGIDGSLLSSQTQKATDIFISEVPGGCMCCAAGLPMQVALDSLLKRARPDRLFIEPTGLGHPSEVMAVLKSKNYREVLSIQATLTLVDARKIRDERYTENETFNQQLDIADVIVASKSDLSSADDLDRLRDYLQVRSVSAPQQFYSVEHGKINIDWLQELASSPTLVSSNDHGHNHSHTQSHSEKSLTDDREIVFPEAGYISIANEGEGFFSHGWVFKPDFVFDRKKLSSLMRDIHAERVKAVFNTKDGVFGFNKVNDALTEFPLECSKDSRIEIIASSRNHFDDLEQQILVCT